MLGFYLYSFPSFWKVFSQILISFFFFFLSFFPPFFLSKVANGKIQNLEATVELLLTNEGKLKESILNLEQERTALQKAVEEMQKKTGDTNEKPLLTRQEHLDAD